ncbi:MAG: lipid-A-disaccharide synthase, partial [Flavobacteriales bacterium]|nr:lipid-A-disaccharide synthase [Flavobacteriales bacterium]
EAAVFMVPEVVCYKGNSVSFHIAKWLIKVKYICLVNLILDRPAVKELIQNDFNENSLKEELGKLLNDKDARTSVLKDYNDLKSNLSQSGASSRVASSIVEYILEGE